MESKFFDVSSAIGDAAESVGKAPAERCAGSKNAIRQARDL
jgi:hypothetical protein